MMARNKPQIYFPNLDGLRFFCFISVFFFHSFATEYSYIKEDPIYSFLKYRLLGNGSLGVNFFFVLSGFLITYLLLIEKKSNGRIHIWNFYLRRVLRIWPLFYSCVLFGFVVFPFLKQLMGEMPSETANPLYYLFFINNIDFIDKGLPDCSVLGVLWSVAIEEQFYLIWPLIIAFSKDKYLPSVFLFIITGSFCFRLFYHDNGVVLEHHTISCISDMTVGGLGAYLTFYSKGLLETIKNLSKRFVVLLYLCVGVIFLFRKELFSFHAVGSAIDRLFISCLFILVILEQNFCENSLFKLKNQKAILKMGQYTYGLYCLHMIAILIIATVLVKLNLNTKVWQVILIEGGLSLFIAIIIAFTSYHLFEKRFLLLKDKFSFINTQQKTDELKVRKIMDVENVVD